MEPSLFAQSLKVANRRILEIGCGNGRDAYHLAKQNKVVAVDQSIKSNIRTNPAFLRLSVEELVLRDGSDYDTLYTRFFWHAIDRQTQNLLLEWVSRSAIQDVFIECRSSLGSSPDNTHDRFLVDGKQLKQDMRNIGFNIRSFQEAVGFAPYKGEDPMVIRLHANR